MEELLQEDEEKDTEVIFLEEEDRDEPTMWSRMNQVLLLHGKDAKPH